MLVFKSIIARFCSADTLRVNEQGYRMEEKEEIR